MITDGRGVLVADSDGPAQLGAYYASRPGDRGRAARPHASRTQRRSDTLDAEILATAVPVLSAGRTEGAVRVTQSVDAVAPRHAPLDPRAGRDRRARAAARARRRRADRPPDRPPAAAARRGRRAPRPTATSPPACRSRARPSSRASRARSTRWARGSSGWSTASASSSPTPRTSCARRSAGLRLRLEEARARPATARRSTARSPRSTGCRRWSPSCCCSPRPARSTRPPRRSTSPPPPRAAAARFDERVSTLSGAPRARRSRCAPADLERALDALIENALHYGGGTRRARRSARARSTSLDDGPGIDRGRARGGVRALPPRPRRPRRAARHRARPADRARADAALGRRRHARQPRGAAAPRPRSPSTALNRALPTVTA